MEGILVIDKPDGVTSHDVVMKVRRKFNIKKVGHAGTLDPLATGVLVMLLGKSTKLSNQFMGLNKSYRATMLLGTKTDTADIEGKVLEQKNYKDVTEQDVQSVLEKFEGQSQQIPPMYSALKVKGKKLYELARQGKVVEREPRTITIKGLTMEKFEPPYVQISMECSKGTYVRQLVEDIGEKLKVGACVSALQRSKVGDFCIDQAVKIEEANESHIRNITI